MALSISRLSFEHHRVALGIAETEPRISWRFEGDVPNWQQTGYDIEIARGTGNASRVFSANSSDSLYRPWPDAPLGEAEAASVRARARGGEGSASTPWSDWVSVETGLSNSSWAGVLPITAVGQPAGSNKNQTKRPQYLRKAFDLPSGIRSARLYITALGLYEAEINGKPVGDAVLAPGWQSYHHRHVYNTYDVTNLVAAGSRNALGAVVGEGWYAGRLGFDGGQRNIYGDTIGLLSLLTVTLDNGTQIRIATDDSWKASEGPVISSQIYDGEVYDARLESSIRGWTTASFNDSSWNGTKTLAPPAGALVPPDQPPVRRLHEIKPQRVFKAPSGQTLVDFGQNLVGWLRLRVDGPADTNITIHHAEVLEASGELALVPLRTALARDTILLSGKGPVQWEPKFTYHGFRFAGIDGWPEDTPLDADSITAIVVHADMEETGWFECSHDLLNQFHANVRWSMRGNFLTIPTDCPQRDERFGWTGDAHAFGPTANFLYDTAGFWRSWHRDMWSEMSSNGSMIPPSFVPTIPPGAGGSGSPPDATAVWGDVAVGSPWDLYRAFGDAGLLAEHLPQARGWLDVGVPRRGGDGDDADLWNRTTFQYGDWLDPLAPPEAPGNATTDSHLVADAYLVRMTEIVAEMARALGQTSLVDKYTADHAKLRDEFRRAWMNQSSSDSAELANRTQTAYALALAFDLVEDGRARDDAAATLHAIIEENDYLVGTGFAGTPALGVALRGSGAAANTTTSSNSSSTSDMYRMVLQTRVPSWLYQVVQNGTTTWERWDSMLPNGSVNAGSMTSFNHYAFGSVADWIHQVVGGLAPATPGWRRIAVAPIPGPGVSSAAARFLSPYGEVASRWSVDDSGFHLNVRVPPNARADVRLPGGGDVQTVGSGVHQFDDPSYKLEGD